MHLVIRSCLIDRLLLISWASLIFYLSTAPGEQLPTIDWLLAPDKWAHAFVYGVLAYLAYRVVKQQRGALLLSALYGLGMEVIQFAFFPGRYFEIWDVAANVVGAVITIWLINKFFHS